MKSEQEHWSSPNGCHEDCPACAEEEKREQIGECMGHYNLSDEQWDALSEAEQNRLLKTLLPHGVSVEAGKPEYSALLQDNENECTLGCGCKMERNVFFDTSIAFTFCPMHEHAAKTLKALDSASEWLNEMGCEHEDPKDGLTEKCVVCIANAAIEDVRGNT